MATAGGLENRASQQAGVSPPGWFAQVRGILALTPVTTTIWFAMIALAVLVAAGLNLSWWWVPLLAYGLLAVHELLAFTVFHRGLFPSAERVARVYQWFTLFLGDQPDLRHRGDLTEGLFEGDFAKTIEQATLDKYARVVTLLGLTPGMRVLDVGCGLGDFLNYLKTHGIGGTGLTLSPEQQRIGAARGLDIRLLDFRAPLPPELVGKFDAVTLIGSLEHFNTSYQMGDRSGADAVFARVFRTAAIALSPVSPSRRMFSATLHSDETRHWTLSDWLHAYSFHGHYSGLYPLTGDFERLCAPWFSIAHRQDTTIDYQYSSLTAQGHFGDFRLRWTLRKVLLATLLLMVNPFAPWSWVYHYRRSWLWQFGGDDIATAQPRPARALWYVHQAEACA